MQLPLVFADRYRLDARLGVGAFGEVFEAFDQGLLQRRVAIKLLGRPEAPAPDEAAAARFLSEVRLAGALRHPHIAAVHDAGAWQGRLYMVQELVEGVDLRRFLAEHGPLAVDLALGLARQMIGAVAAAHEQGVLHRDLKPGNLLVDRDHRLVVVDFGLAVSSLAPAEARGGAIGTPGYAAPEQLRGRGDARADQFSLGAVLYLLLTGTEPFVGRDLPETLRRTLQHHPPPPSQLRPGLPPTLDRVVMRALARAPDDRYPTLRELAAELADLPAFEALARPGEALARLSAAVSRRALLVVTSVSAAAWGEALRSPLVVQLGGAPPEAGRAEVQRDPRREIYPSVACPVLLWLDEEPLDRLPEADDGLRAALMAEVVLVDGLGPDDPLLRRLLAVLRAWRPVTAVAVAPRWRLEDLRAAERRGLSLLERDAAALRASLAAELPAAPPAVAPPLPPRPYKFLSYFDAEDESIFFGRSIEISRFTARILTRPIALLYGQSGAGKTSLLRAALAPRLRRAGHRVVQARVFDDPLGEISRAVGGAAERGGDRGAALGAAARAGPLLIVVLDQLEELFLRFPRPAREAVARDLARALDAAGGQLRLVLCLRADYLARLAELREILPISLESGLYLESLSQEAAREAVVGPARLHGVEVEAALLERMWADLGGEGVDPPQLQLVCDALWEARPPGAGLSLRAYQALGEAKSILARHLAAAIAALPPPDRAPTQALLKALISTVETRSVRRLGELARGAALSEAQATRLLDALAARRLVRPLQREDGLWFELTHEVLAVEISRWLSEDDRRVAHARELLDQGLRGFQQLGLLLSPAQVRLVDSLASRLDLRAEERELLARSREADRRGARRALGLGLGLLLAMGALVVLGRFLWLSDHQFVRAREARLSTFRWGLPTDLPGGTLSIARGAADPWFFDRWLGFPRDAWQPDWTLEDLDPALAEPLRAGVDLPDDDPLGWLRARLTPTAAARERFLEGPLAHAGETLEALAEDPAIGPAEALRLAPLLAMGEASPLPALPALLEIAERHAAALRAPGGTRVVGQLGDPLGPLLLRLPPEQWRGLFAARLHTGSGPEVVAELLRSAAPPEELVMLEAALQPSRTANLDAVATALASGGDCGALPALRALVAEGPGGGGETVARAYVRLARGCGGPMEGPVLLGLLGQIEQGALSWDRGLEILRTLHRIDPPSAVLALQRWMASPALGQQERWLPWGYVGDPAMRDALPAGGPLALHAALYLGDPGAVWPSWSFAFADPVDPSRKSWLVPLVAFRSPTLAARAVAQLADAELPVHLRLPLMAIAAQRADAASGAALAQRLSDADIVVALSAVDWLASSPGPLPAELGGASRQAALAAGVIALRRGEPSPVDFLETLEDPGAGHIELVLALEGQRRRWSEGDGAIAGLDSPFSRVRAAAVLALADQPTLPSLSPDGPPWRAGTLARLRFAHAALAFDRALRARVRDRIAGGDLLYAAQLAALMRGEVGVGATLEQVLGPRLPGLAPVELDDEWTYLESLAEGELEMGSAMEWLTIYVPRSLWTRYATDPLLAGMRGEVLFSVLAGARPPIPVEDP